MPSGWRVRPTSAGGIGWHLPSSAGWPTRSLPRRSSARRDLLGRGRTAPGRWNSTAGSGKGRKSGRPGRGLTIPGAAPLPRSVELVRALRPLMRRGPSRVRREIDVPATIRRVADERIWELNFPRRRRPLGEGLGGHRRRLLDGRLAADDGRIRSAPRTNRRVRVGQPLAVGDRESPPKLRPGVRGSGGGMTSSRPRRSAPRRGN